MPYRLIARCAVIFAFLLAPAGSSRGDDVRRPALAARDIDSFLGTDWYGVYLKGQKIGYARTSYDRSGDFLRETQAISLKVTSFGQKSEFMIDETTIFESKAPYRMLRAEMQQRSDPAAPEKVVLVRAGKGFDSTYRAGNAVSRKQIADLDYTLADALAPHLWIRRGVKTGDQALFSQFDVKDAKIHTLTSKVVAARSSLAAGVDVRYFELENESSKERIKFLTRHDDHGRLLSTVIIIFELRLESEQQAKNTEYSQDLFVLGKVKCDRPLGPIRKVNELVLQVDGKEGEVFEDGPRQSVAPAPGGSRLLRLGKTYGKETLATKKEIADGLEETNAYPISHPRIKALALEAIGDAKTPEDKVRRIVSFAADFVRPSLSVTMPTIHDLLDRKQGDCKSYALLVTALARAAGVPAREVSGLLYMGDDQKAFGGHAWNEVVLAGAWVPVDATLRQTDIDATHISFGTDWKAAKNMLTTLGKLSFKVVEVKSVP